MAKTFGLRELEQVGEELGGLTVEVVKTARVVSAVLGRRFTVTQDAENQHKDLCTEASGLKDRAFQRVKGAKEQANRLRKQADSLEIQAATDAKALDVQASSVLARANQITVILKLIA